jgi:outer membrane protein TolC
MKTWKIPFATALLCGSLAAAAPVDLTLGEALRAALERNPALQRQVLEQVRREAESQEAHGALLPSLQAQASQVRHSLNYETFTGEPVSPGVPVVLGPFTLRSFGLSAQAPLLDLSLWRRWRGSKALAESSKAEAEQAREEISALVVGQYLLALRSEAQVRTVQARIEQARTLEDLAVHQEQSGVGTGLDTLRAKVRTQTEQQALLRAQTAQREALSGLVRLLDLPADTELHLAPVTVQEPAETAPGLLEEVRTATASRADFRALEAQRQAAEERVAGAQALRLPTIQAFASLEETGLVKTQLERVFEVGVQVKVPLFTGGRIQAQENQAKAARTQLQAVRRDMEAKVGFEVRTARERLETAHSEVALAEQTLGLAQAELAQARHRFEAGVSTNIELVNAQEELAKAEEGRLDALYRLDQAQADLAHAKGELESRYAH